MTLLFSIHEYLPTLPLTDPIPIFLLVLLIILSAPILNKIKIPHIIGLIIAGVIFGPHGLNVLSNDSSFELFGKVGILYIMFQAGLEIDLNTFSKNKGKSIIFGIYTFVLPMVLGTLSSIYLLNLDLTTSILVASMYASHTLIAYPIVSKMGISRHRTVSITIAGTIITVTASLLILAIIVAMTTGEMDSVFWIKFGISTIVFTAIVFGLLPALSRWFLGKFHDGVAQYIFVLSIIFLASLCAQAAGLEGILGAFFAGLILNRLIPTVSPLMNRIEFVGNAIFIPFFLISIGMQIDLRAFITSAEMLKAAAVMTIVATGSKWAAAQLSRLTSRLSRTEGDLIFGLSNGQAAATLAAAMIGYKLGLIDDNILNGTIVMILFTCIISSIVTEKAARKIAIEENVTKTTTPQTQQRILIPISNPQTMPMLIELGMLMKPAHNNNSLYALTISRDNTPPDNRLITAASRLAAAADNRLNTIEKCDINISNCIVKTIQENAISDVIVGIHRKANLIDTILGSTINSLISSTVDNTFFIYGPQNPTNLVRHMVVVVPAKAEFELGFNIWLDRIKNISSQQGVSLLFYAETDTLSALKNQCRQLQISKATYRAMSSWEDFPLISKSIDPLDTLVVITARKSTLSYNPLFEKIPSYLTTNYATHNFLLIYPQQTSSDPNNSDLYNPLTI